MVIRRIILIQTIILNILHVIVVIEMSLLVRTLNLFLIVLQPHGTVLLLLSGLLCILPISVLDFDWIHD